MSKQGIFFKLFAVFLLVFIVFAVFLLWGCGPQEVRPQASFISPLPGQVFWKDDVSSYLFGTNDTQSWNLQDNVETDPYHIIQPSLKAAHLTLMRSFFFAHSLYDGHPTTDAELDQRISTIENSGMNCLGVLQDITTPYGIQFAKHVVSYLGSRCNMYEIGNESDLAGIPVEVYLQAWNSLVPQLRALNPHAKFGGPVTYNDQGNNCTYTNGQAYCYMRKFLQGAKTSGVLPDFVTFHWYPCYNDTKASCLAKAGSYAAVTQEVKGWVASDLGRDVPIGITEWNMDPGSNQTLGDDPVFMRQFTQRAISAMIQAKLDFANQFDAQNYGGYGALDMFDIANRDQPKAQFTAMRDMIQQYYLSKNVDIHDTATARPQSATPGTTDVTSHTQDVKLVDRSTTAGNFSAGVKIKIPIVWAGDLLIAVAGSNGSPSSWTTPTGWNVGANAGHPDGQGLNWWWKITNGTDSSTTFTLKSSSYADGGAVVLVYRGAAATPIQAVSSLATNDNSGNGKVSSVQFNAASWSGSTNVVSLLFISWQPAKATVNWPADYTLQATANDGYSYMAAGAKLASQAASSLSEQTATLSGSQAVAPTLQVAVLVGH